VSYYGVSKLAGEKYVMLFKNDMHVSVLRYFHVYGERQESNPARGGVVAVFKKQIADGGPVTIHGDGRQKRLFTSVHDVVDANLRCATMDIPSGSVFNCASDRRISVIALAGMLIQKSGKKIVLEYQDSLPGDIWDFNIDNSKIKRELGMEFRPFNP
jgi:nucleoside-diphosphate-sugar epimerase